MNRSPRAARVPVRITDLRGVAQLVTQGTVAVSHIAEGVHQAVLGSVGFSAGRPPGRTGGVTRFVYQSVRTIAGWLGRSADGVLAELQRHLDVPESDGEDVSGYESARRIALFAALNGVMGDSLAASGSPFALPMTFYQGGVPVSAKTLKLAAVGTRIVLLIHGLCMSERQWRSSSGGVVVDHGEALATALNYTPVYLRYNSGRHVSDNGRELAVQLEQLVALWPVPVEEISIVAHSMGGLVARSAVYYAGEGGLRWRGRLKNIVFLGTPQHGAPLERAGSLLDGLLDSTPYTAPFARIGRLRSAGITDLRYGHVLEDDWAGQGRFSRRGDSSRLLPLPADVVCLAIAATTAARRSVLADRLVGDGLVPLHSALGQHTDPRKTLRFARSAQWISYRTGHLALLSSPAVARKLVCWLATDHTRTS